MALTGLLPKEARTALDETKRFIFLQLLVLLAFRRETIQIHTKS